MKYAFTSFSWPSADLTQLLDTAQNFGYQGIEPRLDAGHGHGIEVATNSAERRELRDRIASSDINLCCLGSSAKFADPETVDEQVAATVARIDLAADLDVPLLRVFGGLIPPSTTREEASARIIDALRSVADPARKRGVRVCLETHDDWSSPDDVAAIMNAVNDPAIGVLWDVMHPVRSGGATMQAAYDVLSGWIGHVHVHDGSARRDKLEFRPIGEGGFDHRIVVHLLRDSGYAGYLSGEWINWEPHDVHLPRELATLRHYDSDHA